jgi:hypothetical protein
MQSIFNLKTSTSELESSNYGVTKDLYEQQAPTRDVTGSNFPNGSINFRWQTGATKWWVPFRTYLRFRVSLTRANLTPLDATEDDIAPIMNQCAALFQSAEFRLNDKTISRVSDYLPQIDTLNTRLNKSKAWIDSVGASTNWWQDSFNVRQENVARNGVIDGEVAEDDRDELGFDPTTTLAGAAATNNITFATGTIPDLRNIFKTGDKIKINLTGNNTNEFEIINVISATVLAVKVIFADFGATAFGFTRITDRKENGGSRRVTNYEITWTPPLSIFNVEHAIPACRCELILNPATSSVYKKAVIESRTADKNPTVNYDFNVVDMFLYVNTLEGSRVDNMTYYLDLEQTACQAESGLSTAFSQKNFDVSPATKQLVVAFQDTRAGTNTLYSATKFRSYDALPFVDETQKLTRMFVNYAGVSKPQIDADPLYLAELQGAYGGTDFTTQRYLETILNSGGYYESGGVETLQEWQNRGQYYLFNWSKDGNDRSTRVAVHTGFNTGGGPVPAAVLTNARMLLFSISNQIAKVVIQNGAVTDVQLDDA